MPRKEMALINKALNETEKLHAVTKSFIEGGLCDSVSKDLDDKKFKEKFVDKEYFSAISFSFSTMEATTERLEAINKDLEGLKEVLKQKAKK